MKILLLDLESAPNLAHVWGLWQQNVSTNQLIASGYTMCWAAKWLGEKEIMFDSIFQSSHDKMIREVHKLMDEADAIVHYNGKKFDVPTLNKEFILMGMNPPSPYKQIDLLQTARQQFRFPSNKLDYIAQSLKLGEKVKHMGHELWIKCMAKDPKAWAIMERYNKQDVVLLEKVYHKLLPWIKNHPNVGTYNESNEQPVCTNCGSDHLQKRGLSYTVTEAYQRYQCVDCGSWLKEPTSIKRSDKKTILKKDN